MSDPCATCNCPDKSNCGKKGSSYVADIVETEESYFVETEKNYVSTVVMEVLADENNGKCKCGSSCKCINCTCGDH